MNDRVQVYADLLAQGAEQTLKVARAVKEEDRLRQLCEAKATPLWLVGHLANTMNTLVLRFMLLANSQLTKDQAMLFAPDFAGGTPPSPNPALYPPYEEVLSLYERITTLGIDGIRAMPDEELEAPLKGNVPEMLREKFPTNRATLAMMVHHDAYHRGQLALLSALPR